MSKRTIDPIMAPIRSYEIVAPYHYNGHPKDINKKIRPFIIEELDKKLYTVFKDITERKQFNKAMFRFYRIVFPTAIEAIAHIENTYQKIPRSESYIDTLVGYFYQRMNMQVPSALKYVKNQVEKNELVLDGDLIRIDPDGLLRDICDMRIVLYEGKERIKFHGKLPYFNKNKNGYKTKRVWAGDNYRYQITKHVALFWKMFLIYQSVYTTYNLFDIPEKEYYYPVGEGYADRTDLTGNDYTTWMKTYDDKERKQDLGIGIADIIFGKDVDDPRLGLKYSDLLIRVKNIDRSATRDELDEIEEEPVVEDRKIEKTEVKPTQSAQLTDEHNPISSFDKVDQSTLTSGKKSKKSKDYKDLPNGVIQTENGSIVANGNSISFE